MTETPADPQTAGVQTQGVQNLSNVPPPANYYNGPHWHGAWASVANGNYGYPNQIVPRKQMAWE